MATEVAPPRPRLCHLHKQPDFTGFGFNLHAERGKAGQYIGKIDLGSPAEFAGLLEGDRIIEVNGTNVANENHSQVVQRIKAVSDEVKLLVVDEVADSYYRNQNIIIHSEMDGIEFTDNVSRRTAESEPSLASAPVPTSDLNPDPAALDPVTTPDEEPESLVFTEPTAAAAPLASDDDISETAVESISSASAAVLPSFPSDHRPRLCELKTWPDFVGYGFNLHANKGESTQFIGKIDPGSPAELGGLREGDRIVEVNGVNIDHETHQEVVRLVKSVPGLVTLLVVDPASDLHLTNLGLTATHAMDDIERIVCPDTKPPAAVSFSVTEPIEVVDGEQSSTGDVPPPAYGSTLVQQVNSHPHRARLCEISSWKDGRGYGFSMQGQKSTSDSSKLGQFIGKVDTGTTAESAGLLNGDRIIEVNGDNVEKSTHKEVIEKIKSISDKVTLLVVDAEADKYFTSKGIVVSSSMDDCIERRFSSPKPESALANGNVEATRASSAHPHRARLCVVHSWKDGRGYGFSMQAQKAGGDAAKPSQFIGKVDAGSPSEAAGLRAGDRIIEVNGVNVERSDHKKVVETIKSVPDTVKLLVVDAEADQYFTEKGIIVLSSMSDCVEKVECPTMKPTSTDAAETAQKAKDIDIKPMAVTVSGSGSQSPPVLVAGIEFSASAAEARKRMSKKRSVKDDKRSMKDKYDVFEKM